MRTTGVDVSVFELGGGSFLGDLRSAEIRSETELWDGTSIVQGGVRPVAGRRSVEVSAEILNSGGSAGRVTGLDLSSVILDSVESLGNVGRLRFEGFVRHEEGAGASEFWSHPLAVRKDYRCRVELFADTAGTFEVLRGFGSVAGLSVGLSFVLNGVTVALPMVIRRVVHSMTTGEGQRWVLDLTGQAPVGAAYPSSPVGTGSLLVAALNAPGSALTFLASSRSEDGVGYSGSVLVKEFGFEVRGGSVVVSRYVYSSVGVVSAGVTG